MHASPNREARFESVANEVYEPLQRYLSRRARPEDVRLWAWEQLQPREIALVLDTTANAVSLRLSRAKKKLAMSIERQNRERAGHVVFGHRKEIES